MDPVLEKEIQYLINNNNGDTQRVEFILESIKNKKKIYNSDQKYLINLLTKHSKEDGILERLDFLNPKKEETVTTFADSDDNTELIPKTIPRPTGITVLIILSVISIVYSIGSWIYFSAYVTQFAYLTEFFPIAALVTYIYVLLMFFNIVITIGLYSGKSWGRTVVLITGWIGLIVSIVGLNPLGIIVFGVMVWYLRKEHVKKYFRVI